MKLKYLLTLLIFGIVSNCMAAAPTWESIYKTRPDIKNCNAGELTDSEKADLLAITNYIRSLHKMQPLTYMMNGDQPAQQAALIMTANAILDHTPVSTVECYTQSGYDGASTSNLHLMTSSTESLDYSQNAVIGWLIDDMSASGDQLGHRRAVINPFVNGVAFGRVDGNPKVAGKENYFCTGMSMKYDYYSNTASGLELDYVAYPYNDYPPILFNKDFFLSFSAIPDKTNLWANKDVDFTAAVITMTTTDGKTIAISDQKYDNVGWGSLPNNLQWKASGLVEKVKYLVEIKNVKYNGVVKNYSYWFNLQTPTQEVLAAPVLSKPANSTVDLANNVNFQWTAVTDAESYEFNLSDSQQFTTIASTQTPTTTTLDVQNLTSGKSYYWRVRAKKGDLLSNWSDVWSFTTKAETTTPTIVLLAPADNMTGFDLLGDLKWNKVTKAGAYDFQVHYENNFTSENSLTLNQKLYKDTTYRFKTGELTKQRSYYWRVRPKYALNDGDWSEVHTFKTGSTTDVEDISLIGNLSNIAILPNPVNENDLSVKFNSTSTSKLNVEIYNVLGNEAMNLQNFNTAVGINTISLNNLTLSNGSYWLVLRDESGAVSSTRFIVQR